MGKLKRMDQVRTILQVYIETRSIKATARRLKISKNTIRVYLKKAQRATEDLSEVLKLSDESFLKVFYTPQNTISNDREIVFESKIDGWVKELKTVGVTRRLLWEEYILEHVNGYGYSQFCRRFRRLIGRKDLTLSLDHEPGEKLQVDFAGKKMQWVDPETAEVHDCEILVAVLPFSQYSFVTAVSSQKTTDFAEAINQAFLYLGGLPKVVLSDNLKAFVIRPDRYLPTFNDLCVFYTT